MPGAAEGAHEVAVGEGLGRGHVDDAGGFVGKLGVGEEEVGGSAVVEIVDPGDELLAVALGASEAEAGEVGEDGEDTACVGGHDHRGTEADLAGVRGGDGGEGGFPLLGDFDGEGPCIGFVGVGLVAELAGELVLGEVVGGAVEGAGAGVHPDARRRG